MSPEAELQIRPRAASSTDAATVHSARDWATGETCFFQKKTLVQLSPTGLH
jgi:hypothetical protein